MKTTLSRLAPILVAVAALLTVAAPAWARADFESAVNYAGPNQAQSVVSADFDNDGDQDLAVGGRAGSNNVLLRRNNGDGTFAAPTLVSAGAAQITLATADFNGDGNADLAVRPSTASSVRVLLGNGNGTFGTAIVLAIAGGTSNVNSQSLTTGDFDGNGRVDLAAVLNGSTNNVSVLYNNSCGVPTCNSGGFGRTDFTAGAGPFVVTGGDLNGDGRDDLAIANGTSAVNVLLSTGSGFAPAASYPTTGTSQRSIVARDLDGDGDRDLAVANQGTLNNVYVLLNNGDGTFGPSTSFSSGSGSRYVVAGDFDRDGNADLAVVRATNPGNVAVLLGDGNGAFAKQTEEFSVGNEPLSLVAADFDADGLPDLAAANFQANTVSVLLNETTLSDLTIVKSGPAAATFGRPFDYTVTVTNNGPDPAENLVVTDDLPNGVTFNSATFAKSSPSGSGSCAQAGGTVTCNVGSLASGGTATVTVTINVTTTGTDDLVNTASYTSDADTDPGSKSVTITTPVVAADLSISKSANPDPVSFGENITYTVTVRNGGDGDATNVRVTDPIPDNTTLVSATPSQGSCPSPPNPGDSSGTVTCNLGAVGVGDSATVTIVVRPTAQAVAVGSVSNAATVGSPNDPSDDSASTETTINAANLTVEKEGTPDPVLAGQVLTYTIEVGNSGTATAAGVTVTDPVPANTVFVSAASSQGDCPSPPTPSPGDASGTVRCELGSVAVGGTATVTIEVRPTRQAAEEGFVFNRARVSSPNDPRPDVGSDRNTVVDRAADLSIQKSADPAGGPGDPALAGQPLTYTVTVTNGGPSAAANTTVTDDLPEGAEFVSAATDTGSCPTQPDSDASGGTVGCDLGTLANGATATVTIVVRPTGSSDSVRNTASTRSDAADPDPTNNTTTISTPVTPAADLSIRKTDNAAGGGAPAGRPLTYTITVENDGPSPAAGVRVIDTLPANTAFVSASPGCEEAEGTVACDLGNLDADGTATVIIEVRPAAEAAGSTIRNEARVESETADTDPDNTAAVETRVVASADLSVRKSGSPDPVRVGQPLTYTLTVGNAGPNAATSVNLTDNLPRDAGFVSVTSETGSCAAPDPGTAGGVVRCDLGGIDVGGSAQVTITVRPQRGADRVTNSANVRGGEFDPDEQNNRASVRTSVSPVADLAIRKAAPAQIREGDRFDYRLNVSNRGPSTAQNVLVRDNLPAGIKLVSAPQGCQNRGGTVTCEREALKSGQSAGITLRVEAKEAGKKTNRASVRGAAFDPDRRNNEDSATTRVRAKPAPPSDGCLPGAGRTIRGTAGDDVLYGTAGPDTILGFGGNDRIFACAGTDSVEAGAGNDTVRGDRGVDSLNGGSGNDRLWARDGESDTVNGGSGTNRCRVDRIDVVTGCP